MQKFLLSLFVISSSYALTLSQAPQENTLVIYNDNLALVHESRQATLTPKETTLIYSNVANSIITDSVHISLPKDTQLFTQHYRYDKITKQKLFQAYLNKDVIYKKHSYTLLAYQSNESILKSKNNTLINVATKDIVLPSLPKEFITTPSLVWKIQTKKKVTTTLSLNYLIQKIDWKSNYTLDIIHNKAALTGWITINNNSGKTFRHTQLSLLAGDINRAIKTPRHAISYLKASYDTPVQNVTTKAYEGYHLYTIPFRVTLLDKEKTQIKFFTQQTPIQRVYKANLNNPLYFQGEIQTDVKQYIQLPKLTRALPKGTVRIYATTDKTKILLGETTLKHTPKNTPIELKIGTNFDMKVIQTLISKEKKKKVTFVDIHYKVINNSNTKKRVTLLIPFSRNKGSHITTNKDFIFTKGNLATFTLEVNPNTSSNFDVHFQIKK